MRSRIVLGALFGAAGGFVGFLLQESLIHYSPGLALPVRYLLLCGFLVGGMIWAAQDSSRRASRRQKDLADISRLIEARPDLRALVPADVAQRLLT